MDTLSIGDWIGGLFGLLMLMAIPATAIVTERSQQVTARLKFAGWTGGLLLLLPLSVILLGFAVENLPTLADIIVLPLLLAGVAAVFFYFRQIARRTIDAGLRKSFAYLALVPGVNLLFLFLLLFIPTQYRKSPEAAAGDAQSKSLQAPRYSCFCRGTDKETGEPRTSLNWVFSRRAMFRIFDDRIECGDWTIPFSDVQTAILYKTKQWPLTHDILHFETRDKSFQFNFPLWAKPAKYLNLELPEKAVKLKQDPITILIRLAVVGYIAYEIWKRVAAS